MTGRSAIRTAAVAAACMGALWGGVAVMAPSIAEAGTISGFATIAPTGQSARLGAYDVTVPEGFTGQETTDNAAPSSEDPDLTHLWTFFPTQDTAVSLFMLTLATAPWTSDTATAAPQTPSGLQECLAALPNLGLAEGDPTLTYLGLLPYDGPTGPFDLAFFMNEGADGSQVLACTILPPTDNVEVATLCVAIVPTPFFGPALPAIDQLFSSISPAQSPVDQAAETLRLYQEQRG